MEHNVNIVVKFQIEGLHCWPQAKELMPTVAYLSDLHRHEFHVTCVKKVTHTDRDVEIIMFKRQMQDYLNEKYYHNDWDCCDFGRMSCEELAVELCEYFELVSCEVLEDNENGSFVSAAEISQLSNDNKLIPAHETSGKRIVFICGQICAGKTTLAKSLVYNTANSTHIEVSDIVRRLAAKREMSIDSREDLQSTGHLMNEIQLELIKETDNKAYDCFYITGARQVGLLKPFATTAEFMWLEVPSSTRYSRWAARNRANAQPRPHSELKEEFENKEAKDRELGVLRVKNYIMNMDLNKIDDGK